MIYKIMCPWTVAFVILILVVVLWLSHSGGSVSLSNIPKNAEALYYGYVSVPVPAGTPAPASTVQTSSGFTVVPKGFSKLHK